MSEALPPNVYLRAHPHHVPGKICVRPMDSGDYLHDPVLAEHVKKVFAKHLPAGGRFSKNISRSGAGWIYSGDVDKLEYLRAVADNINRHVLHARPVENDVVNRTYYAYRGTQQRLREEPPEQKRKEFRGEAEKEPRRERKESRALPEEQRRQPRRDARAPAAEELRYEPRGAPPQESRHAPRRQPRRDSRDQTPPAETARFGQREESAGGGRQAKAPREEPRRRAETGKYRREDYAGPSERDLRDDLSDYSDNEPESYYAEPPRRRHVPRHRGF